LIFPRTGQPLLRLAPDACLADDLQFLFCFGYWTRRSPERFV